MQFNRVANTETARRVLFELKKIPKGLLNITDEFGLQIYCFDKTLYPSYIGLIDKKLLSSDGRSYDDTAYYDPKYKSIFIYDTDFEDIGEKAFSTILHEYGHALDDALGTQNDKNSWLSYIDSDIYKRWQQGKGLDWYANTNPLEYFAQAFMAYMNDIGNYKSWSYREHTRRELKVKDTDMFDFFNALCAKEAVVS